MGIQVVTGPSEETISLDLAWAHLSIDTEGSPPTSPFDAWLAAVGIPAAREEIENFTGRSLAIKRYKVTLDEFPDGAIELVAPPVVTLLSVTYLDGDAVRQTLDSGAYMLDSSQPVPWVAPAYGTSWPAALTAVNSIEVTYDAGYNSTTVPGALKAGMLLALGAHFKQRELLTEKQTFVIPWGIEELVRPYRVKRGFA